MGMITILKKTVKPCAEALVLQPPVQQSCQVLSQ